MSDKSRFFCIGLFFGLDFSVVTFRKLAILAILRVTINDGGRVGIVSESESERGVSPRELSCRNKDFPRGDCLAFLSYILGSAGLRILSGMNRFSHQAGRVGDNIGGTIRGEPG